MVSRIKASNGRVLSVLSFSFLFSYLMAFLFEGRVLYGLLEERQIEASAYVVSAIAAHFAGLICGGLFVKTTRAARRALILGMGICLPATAPFFFRPTALWLIGLVVSGLASGCSVASWGYLLKEFTPKNERIKTCADALICSKLLIMLVFCALVAVVLPFLFEDGYLFIFIGIGMAALLSLSAWIITAYRVRKLQKGSNAFVLSPLGAYAGGEFHSWNTPETRLTGVRYRPPEHGEPGWLEIEYMAVSYPAAAVQKVLIPIPEEVAARAEELVRALEARRKG